MNVTVDNNLVEWVIGLRRWFHQHPELGMQERETQQKVLAALAELGIEHRPAAGTGVIATVRGNSERPMIALRADMDALRVTEARTELNRDYRSQNEGVMHACGHDAHMAMLLGAARWLQQHRAKLPGSVRLLFQPSEEDPPGGAVPLVADGGLDGADAVLGLHVLGDAPSGELRFRPGPFMAQTRRFDLTVQGKAGHHMCPQDNIDPVAFAARFITLVQSDIRSALSPDEVYVLGFGAISGGSQFNQTPATCALNGSFRAFSFEAAERIETAMRRLLAGLVEEFRIDGVADLPRFELEVERGYPALVNNPAFTARAAAVLRKRFPRVVDDARQNLGGEDFAYYLERVPGLFAFIGCADPGRGIVHINHSELFDINEPVLGTGVDVMLTIALDFLSDPAAYRPPAT
ncbi:MAG: amidohydrolase [bacterium]